MSEKQELNTVVAKTEHLHNNKSENYGVLNNENKACLSPNKSSRIQPFIISSRQNKI